MIEKMGQNNIFFLKYLLIDNCGLNIRNEAAHSLLALNEYNYVNATLLLVALLRLCKYNWIVILIEFTRVISFANFKYLEKYIIK
ncbi:MAG: DUF4209 domain-containing protein [Methanobrevibacter smithii]